MDKTVYISGYNKAKDYYKPHLNHNNWETHYHKYLNFYRRFIYNQIIVRSL